MEHRCKEKKFLLLQVNDALFPIGGYSHSYGLETYIQKGYVTDESTAWDFIQNNLRYNFAYTELLCASLAFDYAREGNLKKLNELDLIMEASKTPREIRDASRKLGSRFIKALEKLKIQYESNVFKDYIETESVSCANHSCVYGVFCASVGLDKTEVLENYLYSQTSAVVTTCVKSIPLSQSAGQKLLVKSYPVFYEVLERILGAGEEMLCMSTPGFDIRCMQHEALYSRIYMS